jgi:uncharacterized phiE125 gp8 family phage protein
MLKVINESDIPLLSVHEIKAHLRLDSEEENDHLILLGQTATHTIEHILGITFLKKTWCFMLYPNHDGHHSVILPNGPLIEIISVHRIRSQHERTLMRRYHINLSDHPRLTFYSLEPVEVTYSTGYGTLPRHVPLALRQAVLILTAHLYENRSGEQTIPALVHSLIAPFQRISLHGG